MTARTARWPPFHLMYIETSHHQMCFNRSCCSHRLQPEPEGASIIEKGQRGEVINDITQVVECFSVNNSSLDYSFTL